MYLCMGARACEARSVTTTFLSTHVLHIYSISSISSIIMVPPPPPERQRFDSFLHPATWHAIDIPPAPSLKTCCHLGHKYYLFVRQLPRTSVVGCV